MAALGVVEIVLDLPGHRSPLIRDSGTSALVWAMRGWPFSSAAQRRQRCARSAGVRRPLVGFELGLHSGDDYKHKLGSDAATIQCGA